MPGGPNSGSSSMLLDAVPADPSGRRAADPAALAREASAESIRSRSPARLEHPVGVAEGQFGIRAAAPPARNRSRNCGSARPFRSRDIRTWDTSSRDLDWEAAGRRRRGSATGADCRPEVVAVTAYGSPAVMVSRPDVAWSGFAVPASMRRSVEASVRSGSDIRFRRGASRIISLAPADRRPKMPSSGRDTIPCHAL